MVKFIRKSTFIEQSQRIHVLHNLLNKQDYKKILTNNGFKSEDKSYQGFVYETMCIIFTLLKCLPINFSNFLIGKFEEYDSQQKLDDVRILLNVPINQGNDKADMTLSDKIRKIVF